MKISILENKKIAILGFGKTGKEVYEALKGDYDNIYLIDDNHKLAMTTDEAISVIDEIDIVIKSPGIKYDNSFLKTFKKEVIGDIDLAYQYIKDNGLNTKLVAITATNGKTTSTFLINEILCKEGYNSFACGNIGTSPLKIINENSSIDYLVLELSSYQLKGNNIAKYDFAMLMNIDIDHIDYHGTFEDYFHSKLKIFKEVKIENTVTTEDVIQKVNQYNALLNLNQLSEKSLEITNKVGACHIPVENIQIIVELLLKLKIDVNKITKYIQEFPGLEHRLELVNSPKKDVRIINDSKATNVMATNAAIKTTTYPTTLILGGSVKEEDYSKLDVDKTKIKNVIICGDNQDMFTVDDAQKCLTLCEAIKLAAEITKQGTILFSPASASFDEFDNYAKRGEFFKKTIIDLYKGV